MSTVYNLGLANHQILSSFALSFVFDSYMESWFLLLPLVKNLKTGSPVVKTSPSNAGTVGLIPGQGAKIPLALGPKNQNI